MSEYRENAFIYMPTPGQQIFLSLIGIPMSMLSIIGSYFIIRHARAGKGHSSYKQIMIVASACDMIWSASWFLQPFLSDSSLEFQSERQIWIWAFGNSASCTFLGAMTQFSFSAHWFSGLISFYFLLTIRFQVKQATFAKVLPFLEGFIVLWSVGTAIAAAVMGRIHPLGVSPGCWVGGDGFCQGDDCNTTILLGWIIGAIPSLLMLMVVVINNLILYCHVRKTVVEGQRRALEAQMELSRYSRVSTARNSSKSRGARASGGSRDSQRSPSMSSDHSFASIIDHTGEVQCIRGGERESRKSFASRFSDASVFSTGVSLAVKQQKGSVMRSSEKQWKRVQEVGRQSFLYVGAYLLSFGWAFAINYLDSTDYELNENAGNIFLPLLMIQSVTLPTMGFFNCCVYFRPKYLSVSREFPNESRIWRIKRTIYGKTIKPTLASARPSASASAAPETEPPETLRINLGGDIPMSSLAHRDSHSEVGSHDRDRVSALDLMGSEDFSIIIEGDHEESSRRKNPTSSEFSNPRLSLNESKQEWSEPLKEEEENI